MCLGLTCIEGLELDARNIAHEHLKQIEQRNVLLYDQYLRVLSGILIDEVLTPQVPMTGISERVYTLTTRAHSQLVRQFSALSEDIKDIVNAVANRITSDAKEASQSRSVLHQFSASIASDLINHLSDIARRDASQISKIAIESVMQVSLSLSGSGPQRRTKLQDIITRRLSINDRQGKRWKSMHAVSVAINHALYRANNEACLYLSKGNACIAQFPFDSDKEPFEVTVDLYQDDEFRNRWFHPLSCCFLIEK